MNERRMDMKVSGAPGELIDRLNEALTAQRSGNSALHDVGVVRSLKLGLDDDFDPRHPENLPEKLTSKVEYLVSLGMFESFLVISIRDEMTRWFSKMSSFSDADASREVIREDINRMLM